MVVVALFDKKVGHWGDDRVRNRGSGVLAAASGTCKKISTSRGMRLPERSSHSRMVSADAFGVVTRRIYKTEQLATENLRALGGKHAENMRWK